MSSHILRPRKIVEQNYYAVLAETSPRRPRRRKEAANINLESEVIRIYRSLFLTKMQDFIAL